MNQVKRYYEKSLRKKGYSLIVGIDEAGRGPLAGPVVAAAVAVKNFNFSSEIDDSKRLSPAKRQVAYKEILKKADVGIGISEEDIIDEVNILKATFLAMQKAISSLLGQSEQREKVYFLIDGCNAPQLYYPFKTIVSGDRKCFSVACASIVAKVTRDRIMYIYHRLYPQYGFAKHKGYGTKEHLLAIQKFGPSPIHRKSFYPIRKMSGYY